MFKKSSLQLEKIHTIIFDFDGVFTDNKVFTTEDGLEMVKCCRSDGLGLDILRRFIKKTNWKLDYFILSTEKNPVVISRAKKLKIKCEYGIENKLKFVKNFLANKYPGELNKERGIVYLGNDINDLKTMEFVGISVAPIDAHHFIKNKADLILRKKGGDGFVREFIEKLISCNNYKKDAFLDLI